MSHPLFSWDLVSESIQRRIELSEDIINLQNLLNREGIILPDQSLIQPLIWEDKTIIVTDAQLHISYATKNIFDMNGYKLKDIQGKTPKIFQGPLTEKHELVKIRESIHNKKAFSSQLTNYKKDGSLYKCSIDAFPVFNHKQELIYFIALEITLV